MLLVMKMLKQLLNSNEMDRFRSKRGTLTFTNSSNGGRTPTGYTGSRVGLCFWLLTIHVVVAPMSFFLVLLFLSVTSSCSFLLV